MSVAASLGILAMAALLALPPASAQDSPPVRVRGTIERAEGSNFVVKARDGSELKITLAENATIVALVKASVADIKPGSFVGITGMPQPDGSQRAVEVHIFPEAMRGTGEGHYAWDLRPQSTMTNGNVEESVAGTDGQSLRIKYKDGEKKIIVTPNVPIVRYEVGDKSELKAGAAVNIAAATKKPDGTFGAARINVGRNGLVP